MRYHELAERSMTPENQEIIKKGVALIKRDCQPFLTQVEDPMSLRRGVKRDYEADRDTGRPLFHKRQAHLTDRTPRGEYMKKWHSDVNEYFTLKFGFPFRNGIMTVGDQMQSSFFGVDIAVFPIGDFKFLWSKHVQDLNQHSFHKQTNDTKHSLLKALEGANYQTTDLQSAIKSKKEIMIWADEYYILDNTADRNLVKKLLK